MSKNKQPYNQGSNQPAPHQLTSFWYVCSSPAALHAVLNLFKNPPANLGQREQQIFHARTNANNGFTVSANHPGDSEVLSNMIKHIKSCDPRATINLNPHSKAA